MQSHLALVAPHCMCRYSDSATLRARCLCYSCGDLKTSHLELIQPPLCLNSHLTLAVSPGVTVMGAHALQP